MMGGRFILFPILVATLFGKCSANGAATTNNEEHSTGIDYELVLAKMNYLEYKFLELQTKVVEQSESLAKQSRDTIPVQGNQQSSISITNTICSCQKEKSKKSDRYWMKLDGYDPFEVYCEQTFYGGGWIVIQNRYNGSLHFNRSWTEYKQGFGNLDGEFWLGLETIHRLTTETDTELLIHLEDFDGVAKYARYSRFTVGSECDLYKIETLEGHSGNLDDSFAIRHDGMNFSTPDIDNDNALDNCAIKYSCGWWFDACFDSNLNGVYADIRSQSSMSWYKFSGYHKGLKVSKMMIRGIE